MGFPTGSNNRIGYGLMNHTWKPTQSSDEQAFKAIITAVDAGSIILNTGEFYGTPDPELGLKLLGRFFDAHPEYVDRTYVSVKGGMKDNELHKGPDASEESLRRSITNSNKLLGKKRMDLFQMARVDKKTPIEDAMKTLLKLRDEGLFQDIGLSEVAAATIRKAAAVAPIAAVEVEYSPWSLDIEQNGVLAACRELGIKIAAYCPLGRGMIDPKIKSADDIPEGDNRKSYPRFQPGNIEKNLALADKIRDLAQKKDCTGVQIVLAWEVAQDKLIYPIPGSTRPEGVAEAAGANGVKLSDEELQELRKLIDEADVIGERYPDYAMAHTEG